jgi:hypothetical protein
MRMLAAGKLEVLPHRFRSAIVLWFLAKNELPR